jgi:hypothetical protein
MSQLEVDKIVPQSGTTLTIGDSGDTITISAGATLSGSLNADNLDSGTVPDARISGAYTGITQTGTLTSFASTGIDDNATSTAITIDSSQNVGIGTNSPVNDFNYTGLTLSGSTGSQVVLQDDGTTEGLIWNNNAFYIEAKNTNPIAFRTNNSERMRIDSSGNLMVGKTAIALATVGNELRENGQITGTRDGGASLILNRLTSNGEIAQFYKDGAVVGRLSVTSTPGFAIGTPNTLGSGLHLISGAILPSTSTGGTADNSKDLGASSSRFKDLYLGGGAFLGGTGTANKLDDYEEGTWTPDMRGSSGSAGSSSTSGTGTYIKIGKLVFLRGSFLRWSNLGSYSGDAQLFGLPFTASGTDGSKTAGSVCWVKRVEFPASAYNPPGITVENGQNYIEFMKQESNLGVAFELTTTYFDDVLNSFHITCMYETEA